MCLQQTAALSTQNLFQCAILAGDPDFMDKIVLITGASRGIGAATALLAARQGWAVAVNYQGNQAAADAVVQRIRDGGGTALAVQADVADEAQVLAMFAAVDAQLGRITALVNNAGVVDRTQRVDEMSVARLRRMFDINVIGSFVCAREVAAEGIRVNAVRPGLIETDIHASGGLPDRVRDLAHLVPMQRGGTAEEVAEAIVWLMSDASPYTTMSLLEVSGGR